mmetsp:Transcript_8565/g.24587  ORF Transcript_8565/g.24587 Transcript_8565/m.24587 type:complete len:212 (+) Transcript_8565:3198-3833(+)
MDWRTACSTIGKSTMVPTEALEGSDTLSPPLVEFCVAGGSGRSSLAPLGGGGLLLVAPASSMLRIPRRNRVWRPQRPGDGNDAAAPAADNKRTTSTSCRATVAKRRGAPPRWPAFLPPAADTTARPGISVDRYDLRKCVARGPQPAGSREAAGGGCVFESEESDQPRPRGTVQPYVPQKYLLPSLRHARRGFRKPARARQPQSSQLTRMGF